MAALENQPRLYLSESVGTCWKEGTCPFVLPNSLGSALDEGPGGEPGGGRM